MTKIAAPFKGSTEDIHVIPASSAQQRLWFLDRLHGPSTVYNITTAVKLIGALDVDALRRALHTLVARHDSLRMYFTEHDGNPQVELLAVYDPLETVDASERGSATPGMVDSKIREYAQRPFDLSTGPLLRVVLLNLDEQTRVLLLSMHHIITDEWSMELLWRELSALYRSYLAAEESPLKALEMQYQDYAAWQRKWMRGAVFDQQLQYWRCQLTEAPAILELPTDYARPTQQRFHGGRVTHRIGAQLSQQVHHLSKERRTTLFMTLLSAFSVLLSRYSGQHDLCVGTPVANRHHPHSEELVGFLLNTLVLRVQLEESERFSEVLARTREVCLGAYDHQDLPFEQVVEELQPQRSMSRHPLFQVMFSLQHEATNQLQLPGVQCDPMVVDRVTSKFDLTLSIESRPNEFVCLWSYDCDLFERARIERMGGHFRALLQGIVQTPEQPIATLPLLTPAEHQQLQAWTNLATQDAAETPIPESYCLHQLFETRAAMIPDQTALVYGSSSLTYQELNQRANQVAHYLREHNVGPEVPVLLHGQATPLFVIGVLGILKAGGIYVPVDKELPDERLATIVDDTGAPLVLSTEPSKLQLEATTTRFVCLAEMEEAFHRHNDHNPSNLNEAEDAAYIIYTSGSTGRPKGVIITHRSICHYLAVKRALDIDRAGERTLCLGSVSVDVTVSHIMGPITVGGTLVLAQPEARRDPRQALAEIRQHRIQFFGAAPAMLAQMVELPEFHQCHYVRGIITGSEVVDVDLKERVLESLNLRLINAYGPTEVTITALIHDCQRDVKQTTIPIGRPIPGVRAYILDSNLQPVPIGIPGELFLAGIQLARGYLNSPEFTEERFIPDPFSDIQGDRMYRTGDLVKWRSDGEVEFLGRLDHQVKLRGFRIELGEIESVLMQHPQVENAVVVLRKGARGEGMLVAYVVVTGVEATELLQYLKRTLPDYMLPSRLVSVAELPMTASGKVDRRALAGRDLDSVVTEDFVAPSTPMEGVLAALWETLLGYEGIGRQANFFDLGGHSLLATQLVSRIHDKFQVDLPLRAVFDYPVLAELADVVSEKLDDH